MTSWSTLRCSFACAFIAFACTPIVCVAQGRAVITAADSALIETVVYTTALLNGTGTAHASDGPEVICVAGWSPTADPTPSVIELLQRVRASLVRPKSACYVEPLLLGQGGKSLVVDSLTRKRGISISVSFPTIEADSTLVFETGYYQNGLSSAGWRCRSRRTADHWEVAECQLLWIS